MWNTKEGSTGRLIQLCVSYFVLYVITGVVVKYFLGKPELGLPGMKELEFLVYNTSMATGAVLLYTIAAGWYRLKTNRYIEFAGLKFPVEYLYIIPSGVCTAVVIPTTTLMYTLPISVMVAMVIMRGAVIFISRMVDAVQIRQGILKRKVYWEENVAVVLALSAVSANIFFKGGPGAFDFVRSPAAMTILGSYIVAYSIRIYIMNYYKNTRGHGVPQDNKGFFAIEQFSAAGTLFGVAAIVFFAPDLFGWNSPQLAIYRGAIIDPKPMWGWAFASGVFYGLVAFVSVFIFMFKGRTATFAGLANRLTSLVAGTVSTLIFYLVFGGRAPSNEEWFSLVLIFVAVGFLTRAEQKRAAELALNSD